MFFKIVVYNFIQVYTSIKLLKTVAKQNPQSDSWKANSNSEYVVIRSVPKHPSSSCPTPVISPPILLLNTIITVYSLIPGVCFPIAFVWILENMYILFAIFPSSFCRHIVAFVFKTQGFLCLKFFSRTLIKSVNFDLRCSKLREYLKNMFPKICTKYPRICTHLYFDFKHKFKLLLNLCFKLIDSIISFGIYKMYNFTCSIIFSLRALFKQTFTFLKLQSRVILDKNTILLSKFLKQFGVIIFEIKFCNIMLQRNLFFVNYVFKSLIVIYFFILNSFKALVFHFHFTRKFSFIYNFYKILNNSTDSHCND